MVSVVASASVIGTEIVSYTIPIGKGTVFTHTTSFSEQSGVGKQTENYLVYEPSDSIKPIITYGDYLYGAGRTSDEIKSLLDDGRYPIAGANADFFSLQTGVPMSNLIIDGKIISIIIAKYEIIFKINVLFLENTLVSYNFVCISTEILCILSTKSTVEKLVYENLSLISPNVIVYLSKKIISTKYNSYKFKSFL